MQGKILWADDEIELLKPHILFLESKEYASIPLQTVKTPLKKPFKSTTTSFSLMKICLASVG